MLLAANGAWCEKDDDLQNVSNLKSHLLYTRRVSGGCEYSDYGRVKLADLFVEILLNCALVTTRVCDTPLTSTYLSKVPSLP